MTKLISSNILIITGDPVGKLMAGPAIRAWNIARLLSTKNHVRLASMSTVEADGSGFEILSLIGKKKKDIKLLETWADVIIVQGYPLLVYPLFAQTTKKLVVDIYDPLHLEDLAQSVGNPLVSRKTSLVAATWTLNHQLLLGDYFVCSSEKQRHFWLGQLAALGRVNPENYDLDQNLEGLIAIAPFGISNEPPVHKKSVIRGVIPGINHDDFVLIWAGGLYDWFDPLTLMEAVAEVARRDSRVKLLFMGIKHPNPNVPEMPIVAQVRKRARDLAIENTHVFFNESWVPFDDRADYLLESDVGVSTHFQHLETTFSFRTRILDYLWTGLPILTTRGDAFAELVEENNLGLTVPEQNTADLAAAILRLMTDPELMRDAKVNVESMAPSFFWEKTLEPLIRFCANPIPAPDRRLNYRGTKRLAAVIPGQRNSILNKTANIFDRIMYYVKRRDFAGLVSKVQARLVKNN